MNKAKIISCSEIKIIDYDYEVGLIRTSISNIYRPIGVDDEEKYKEIDESFESQLKELEEYKELVLSSPVIENDLDSAIPYYEEEDGVIVQKWTIVHNEINLVQNKIARLKQELINKDYINMKRFQGQIPDDQWAEFTLWADAKRVEIRELEKLQETANNANSALV